MESVELSGVLDFLRAAERLKNTTRSGFTSEGRPESVAEHTWRLGGLQEDRPDQAQHGVGAERHRQPAGQAGAGFTAQRQAKILLRLAQAEGAAGHRHGDLRQPLGKNPRRASVGDAAKAADAQVEFDPAALPRQIRQPATIATVSSEGGMVTQRARRRRAG